MQPLNSALCPLCADGIGHQMDMDHAAKVATLKKSHAELRKALIVILSADDVSPTIPAEFVLEAHQTIAAAEKLDKGA